MKPKVWLALCALGIGAAAWAGAPADEHLLRGAERFRAERYADALVEFKVAERLGAGASARYYVAASLAKLGRPEEALEEFAAAEEAAPQERDALLDYYRALACYDARLYTCADRLLASVVEKSGPRIAGLAARVRGDLGPLLAAVPTPASIDWYRARGEQATREGRLRVAVLYFEEMAALARKRPDHYRLADAEAQLGQASARLTEARRRADPPPPPSPAPAGPSSGLPR